MTERKAHYKDAVVPVRLSSEQVRRIDEAVKNGAAPNRAELMRMGTELFLTGSDPRMKSAMAFLLNIMVKELSPVLQSAFEQLSPEIVKQLGSLDVNELGEHFKKLFAVSEHTQKAVDVGVMKMKQRKKPGKVA